MPFKYHQRPLMGRPRGGQVAEGMEHQPQVVDTDAHVWMVRPVDGFIDRQGPLKGCFGPVKLA